VFIILPLSLFLWRREPVIDSELAGVYCQKSAMGEESGLKEKTTGLESPVAGLSDFVEPTSC